MAVTGTD
jgi:WD40 repeat protein